MIGTSSTGSSPAEELIQDYEKYQITKKIIIKAVKILSGVFSSALLLNVLLVIIIIFAVVTHRQGFSTSNDYTKFSAEVEQYRTMVQSECAAQGIEYYTDVVLAIMQCTTGGQTSDPMNASEKESNTLYGKNRGDIQSVSYSIKCGVTEIKKLIDMAGVVDLYDTAHLSIMYQAYELDREYVTYAFEHGGYTAQSAKEYMEQESKEQLRSRNTNFAIQVSMYMSLVTNGFKRFIYPLAIHSVLSAYNDDEPYIIYGGVLRQVVISCSDGEVTDIETFSDYSNITITTDEYTLHYDYITNIVVAIGDTVKQGDTLGMVMYLEDFEDYGMKFYMTQNDETVNPEEWLDKLEIEREPLDDASIEEGQMIAEYAKNCVDNMSYVEGGTSATGCDEIGFIYNVFSSFTSYDEDYFNIPTDSYEDIISCKYVSYTNDVEKQIRPQIMYEGDVIIYADSEGNYVTAGVYIGNSRVVHMTEYGCVQDFYNFATPAVLVRLLGNKMDGMVWPLPGYTRSNISSPFQPDRTNPVTGVVEAHRGTDIAAPTGTEVVAADAGEVVDASYSSSAGYHIIIDHGNGIKTYYYHSSQLIADVGDIVEAGDVIMLVGSTGQSTGPHLHFGITVDGEWVDAMDYTYIGE